MRMGAYCKAYATESFEAYEHWPARAPAAPAATAQDPDTENEEDALAGYYFLQDNYTVTRGLFPDEDVVFQDVTPAWIEFCTTTLGFHIPDFVRATDVVNSDAAS